MMTPKINPSDEIPADPIYREQRLAGLIKSRKLTGLVSLFILCTVLALVIFLEVTSKSASGVPAMAILFIVLIQNWTEFNRISSEIKLIRTIDRLEKRIERLEKDRAI